MNFGGIFDLENKEDELAALEEEHSKPDFWNNPQRAQKSSRRMAQLRGEVTQYNEIESELQNLEVLVDLAIEEDDESFNDEIDAGLKQISQQVEAIELKLMLDGEHDINNALLYIHPGAGGTESQDWAAMLMRMYLRWCERRGYKTETLDLTPGDEAGIKATTILVTGEYAYGYLRAEAGIHRLVRLSPFDFNHRRHTSFAAVAVSPEIDDTIEIDIDAADLRIDYYRSSGAGGQHVNVTDSAVRMTHIPTGIVVQCQNERSQHKNREVAMKILRSRLYEFYEAQRREEISKMQEERLDINFGSQIRSYVLHPYRLVKDLRTNIETGNVDSVMDGDLNAFIEGYLKHKQRKS